ncbi:MAG: FtsX-like permease family protein [Pseudomonadota bacterium]
MRRVALLALLAHWRRRPGQLATLLIGIALATALWSAVQAINVEARSSYDRAATVLGTDRFKTLTDPSGPITLETFISLRRAGWLVSPVLQDRFVSGDTRLQIVGLEMLTAPAGSLPVTPAGGEDVNPLDMISAPGLGFAAPETIAQLDSRNNLPPLQASDLVPPGQVVTDIGTAERLLDRQGEISFLMVLPEQPLTQTALSDVAPDLILKSAEQQADLARLTNSFHLNLTAFGMLSFVVGLFIVHGAIGLAFEQRRGTFRTLRALGLPARDLMLLLVIELLVLAMLAGAIGIAIGYAIAGALLPDVASTLDGLYGARVPGVLSFSPAWALAALAFAILGALVAAGQGLWRVQSMPLLASAQSRAWATVSAVSLRRQAMAGAMLIAAGIASSWLFNGLLAGFALLAGLLLGAALLLPTALATVLAIGASSSQNAESQWFWADTRQQLPGLSLALMALLLALAANIGVSTMVGSFRLTFTGWLDQRLASELYLTVSNAAESERLETWLQGRAEAALPIISVDSELEGAAGKVYGVVDHETYREQWPILSARQGVWDDIAAGNSALINEQLAYREDLAVGDPVNLAPGWTLPIAGIYSDYGNPKGQAMVSLDLLESRYPDRPRLNFGLRTDEPDALATALRAEFGPDAVRIVDQATIKRFSLRVFERTFTVTAALNVLTLSVAGFAMLTALLTLAGLRLPQLAPVWALGMTRKRLVRLEVIRSLALAALTFVFAVPVGLALAWSLLAVVNVEAFGWRLPMHVFPTQWLVLLLLALAAALVAAILPARHLARTGPANFLKVFADER